MSKPFAFPIIVLAAGQSSRMQGADKLMEVVEGLPLLRRQAMIARAATSSQLLIALPPAPHPRYGALEGLDAATVVVHDSAEGMNASLRTAFGTLEGGTDHAMLLLADMPDLTVDDLRTVAKSVTQNQDARVWRGTTSDGVPGHPIVFHHSLFGAFAELTGDSGGKDVIIRAKDHVHLVPLPGNNARLDLDTPEAWAAWRKANDT